MTEGRLVSASVADTPWRDVVDRCAVAAGPFTPTLLAAWTHELDVVQARIDGLERAAPHRLQQATRFGDGLHALVALATARLGTRWSAAQLLDVAAAVELAHRATRHHDAVADQTAGAPTHGGNRQHVLDGDWSITQAAVLAADVGPRAYRLLVRGYGMAQLARLEPDRAGRRTVELLATAAALGGYVAAVPEAESACVYGDAVSATAIAPGALSDASRVCRWAVSSLSSIDAESPTPFTPAAAR